MLGVGVSGLPGAGKSAVARMFAELGAPVFDADAVVRALYAPGGAAARALLARCPELDCGAGGLDREKLRERLRENPAFLTELEAVVHPLVAKARADFLRAARKSGASYAVLEIPLLFETGAEKDLDAIVWVEAPEKARRARLRARPAFDEVLNAALEARLLPAAEKRARADYVINTGGSLADTRREVRRIHERLLAKGA